MRFVIMSRHQAEDPSYVEEQASEPHIWISITDPDSSMPEVHASRSCRGVLTLRFHDVQEPDHRRTPMSEVHADQIVDFVSEHQDDVELILVHCAAGMSRSPACAMALSIWLCGDDSGIGSNPMYMPNPHVCSLILECVQRRS